MEKFFDSFEGYCKEAQFDSIAFWAFPLGTFVLIWILTVVFTKLVRRQKFKKLFLINKIWIASSLAVGACIIGLICFLWTKNYFSHTPWALSLLIALIIAMNIPIIAFLNLRASYSQEGLKEIVEQPKTLRQLDSSITLVKSGFKRIKYWYVIPLLAFALLLLYFYKGTNLIAIVYDNSPSMQQTNATDALSETFDNLEENNRIILTTLDGFNVADATAGKTSMSDILTTTRVSDLKAGNPVSFNTPAEAKGGLAQTLNPSTGSPICESMWKTYLFVKENNPNEVFRNKLLIVLTDGEDDIGATLGSGKFFFDDPNFAEYFPPENLFIIDYSTDHNSPFMSRFEQSGVDVYPADNNKQAYLDGLDNALQAFKNNWNLIYWTILIFCLFTVIGLFIQPKKII